MDYYDHPYYPRELYLPTYIPISTNKFALVFLFFAVLFLPLCPVIMFIKQLKDRRFKVWHFVWFFSCFLIHTFFEGYFVLFNRTILSRTDFFAELWKEYANCDSRYVTQDLTVFYIEATTAFLWGPASLFICLLMLNGSLHYHILVFIVSLGQLYGSIIYVATASVPELPYSDPSLYYHLFYFGFFNIFWFIIPVYLMWYSWIILTPHLCTVRLVLVESNVDYKHGL
ncbi:hypothetical protein DSO57_1026652 [Entomophthora muscae]|uniref:Uncharacterized protein n=1 Tax=Entomophthora muscae TaxID=34485 RepID=A0ACC2RGM3_9FUNG|nr:hypothetical protein DSO57_1026652 [Entomophthora muscae]